MTTRISAWAGHEAAGGVIDWIVDGNRTWTVTVPGVGWVFTGRGVFLAATAIVILLLAGIGVALSRKAELRRRWTTWAVISPAVGIPIWIGRGTTALLAAALGLQAVRELSRLTRLPKVETSMLAALAVAYPLAAWLRPGLMALAPLMVLVCAVPAVLAPGAPCGPVARRLSHRLRGRSRRRGRMGRRHLPPPDDLGAAAVVPLVAE